MQATAAILRSGTEPFVLEPVVIGEPRSDEVIVRIVASGICHTDYEVLKDNYGTGAFPVVPGHEYAGTIVDVGAGVSDFSIRDRVAVDPNFEWNR